MASILCKICGSGIHYHSEANGIQYLYFSKKNRDTICRSRFDSQKIEINNGYPKLFRSDTIEEDFEKEIAKVWICPNCGSIIVFNKENKPKVTFVKTAKIFLENYQEEGLAFVDYLWDKITETTKPDSELISEIPTCFVRVYGNGLLVSQNDSFSDPIIYFKSSEQ